MLIASDRHGADDLEQWALNERVDAVNAARFDWQELESEAVREILTFAAKPGGGYLGVSWGKDSVVVAHLMHLSGARLPVVWVRVKDKENPDCPRVRDAFLASHTGLQYDEIEVEAPDVGLTSSLGFDEAAHRYGYRHVSGVRAAESRVRKLRTMRWGKSTEKTCAPIAWWRTEHVFAYMHHARLPVHPAYACTMGSLLDRQHLRVAAVGGKRGTGHGRREWEQRYYPDALRQQCGGGS